jgi:dihydroorotase
MGVSNNNSEEVLKVNKLKRDICGIKIFMGSSTGNMLVDNFNTLEKIFSESELLIATHCEDEATVKRNLQLAIESRGSYLNASDHPIIRNEEACYLSSSRAFCYNQFRYHTR